MPKSISADVLTNQQKRVTTQATLVTIVRPDGLTYRITNHDQDIEFDGNVFTHNIPFTLTAVSTGSQLAVDNMDMSLALDGTVFKLVDFKRQAFARAEIMIQEVDYTDPEAGAMTLRKGWFGPMNVAQYGVARITLVGLLKVLDFEVGRVYQPSCDADLGDKRCKVAIDLNQVRDWRSRMRVGEWRYVFNPDAATALTVLNPSFEDDGEVALTTDPITGWTRVPVDGAVVVNDGGSAPAPTDGSYMLIGENFTGDPSRSEVYVYQDIDLVAGGIDDEDIDDGRISLGCFVDLMQTLYLLDPVRFSASLFDGDGNVIVVHDTGFIRQENFDAWRTQQRVFPVFEGARTLRLMIGFRREDGEVFNCAADNVRVYWWDHVNGNPWDDVIHKVARIAPLREERYAKYFTNSGFETDGAEPVNTAQTITGWTKAAGSYWGVDNELYGNHLPPEASWMLIAGDDTSGTQQTYTISTTKHFVNDWAMPAAVIDAGRAIGSLHFTVLWGDDTESAASVDITWLNASNSVISTETAFPFEAKPTIDEETHEYPFVVPANTRSMRVTLKARSPAAASLAQIAFDEVFIGLLDSAVNDKRDPLQASGVASTVFSTTDESYTFDGDLIWRAHTHHVQYDVVASVSSRKSFTGTDIAGGPGAYETGQLMWISGANRGQKNVIRIWDSGTKGIKLYFESVNDIQVGDRFQYIRSCQKRFVEDCQLRYDNVINFRGFPYLPGRIQD